MWRHAAVPDPWPMPTLPQWAANIANSRALADSLADIMEQQGLPNNARELREAVGLENYESSDQQ